MVIIKHKKHFWRLLGQYSLWNIDYRAIFGRTLPFLFVENEFKKLLRHSYYIASINISWLCLADYANEWTAEITSKPIGAAVFIMTQHRSPSYFSMRVKEPAQSTVLECFWHHLQWSYYGINYLLLVSYP